MAKKFTLREGYEPRIGTCTVCNGPLKAKGLCHSHYASMRRRLKVAEMKIANTAPKDDYWTWIKKELNL